MRSIITISVSPQKKKAIEKRAKRMGKTTSAYVLNALELEKQLISEDELLEMAKTAEKEFKTGKTKKLSSLQDLM